MNYGLYLSAAGALTSMHRQDVLANNLANVNTVGFKPDDVVARQRLPERLESPATFADPNLLLEQLGGGVLSERTSVDLRQGNLITSKNPLDLAVDGDGFFVVASPDKPGAPGGAGAAGGNQLRLTRDGRFTLSADHELITAGAGLRVLDADNKPIRLDPSAPITIRTGGQIVQNDQIVATLGFISPADPKLLSKVGDNLLRLNAGAARGTRPAHGQIQQGTVENSAVDPIMALNSLIDAAKSVQYSLKMMQYHDNIMGQAINTLGRVA